MKNLKIKNLDKKIKNHPKAKRAKIGSFLLHF